MQEKQNPDAVLLGPIPYNRFMGNPPAGTTAEEAFEAESGYPWLVQLNAHPILDKINKLEASNKELKAEVDKLKSEIAAKEADFEAKLNQMQTRLHQTQKSKYFPEH